MNECAHCTCNEGGSFEVASISASAFEGAEALAERSVEIAQAIVPLAGALRSRVGVAEGVWREGCACVRVNVRCVWLRSCVAVLRVIVCLSSCVWSGSRVCPVRC